MTAPPDAIDIVGLVSDATRQRLADLQVETPVPADRIGKSLRIVGIDDLLFAKNAVLSVSDIHRPDSLKAGFVELNDAVVTPFGFVIKDDLLIFNTQILPERWMKGSLGGSPEMIRRIFGHNFIHKLDVWRQTCLLSLPAEMETLTEPAFIFNSRLTCFNFAHLVHDTLIQTPTYLDGRAHLGGNVIPLLVGPGFPSPVTAEIFSRSAPGAEPRFLKNRFHRVPRLLVPTTHFSPANGAIARGAVARLTQNLAEALAGRRTAEKRRLFISREDSGRGSDREPRFANADALARALNDLGLESVVASRLGVDDYLRTFVNAELIVGLHGAGLMNAVLSEAPRVLEINVPGYPDWRSLALFYETGMGAPSRRVVTPPPENGVATYDIPAILDACRTLLATPCPPAPAPL